jgi:hypothetical protein
VYKPIYLSLRGTEQVCLAVTFTIHVREALGSDLGRDMSSLCKVSLGFSQSLQINAGIIPRLDHS